jgi:hypothetical protein
MQAEFVRDTAHDFAEALRANPLAAADVQELMDVLKLSYADFVSAEVIEADLQQIDRAGIDLRI